MRRGYTLKLRSRLEPQSGAPAASPRLAGPNNSSMCLRSLSHKHTDLGLFHSGDQSLYSSAPPHEMENGGVLKRGARGLPVLLPPSKANQRGKDRETLPHACPPQPRRKNLITFRGIIDVENMMYSVQLCCRDLLPSFHWGSRLRLARIFSVRSAPKKGPDGIFCWMSGLGRFCPRRRSSRHSGESLKPQPQNFISDEA